MDTQEFNEETVENVKDYSMIVKELSDNNQVIKNLTVTGVNVTVESNYSRVGLTLNRPVKGFISTDNGLTYNETTTNLIFTSNYALSGMIKQNEDYSWLNDVFVNNPELSKVILTGAKIDIVQQKIEANTEYINPFSNNKNANPVSYTHDIIINYIIGIKFSRTGEKVIEKYLDKIIENSINNSDNSPF